MRGIKLSQGERWIVIIEDSPNSSAIIEVHSNGTVISGSDDRHSLHELKEDALHNRLHGQRQTGVLFQSDQEYGTETF